MIRVVVTGASGRMGREVLQAVSAADDMVLAGAVDRNLAGTSIQDLCGDSVQDLTLVDNLDELLDDCEADVLVDFTHLSVSAEMAKTAIKHGVSPLIGTSGLNEEDLEEISLACSKSGVSGALIPNFAIGAVLMMKFAEMAAPHLDYAEVIEMHHEKKLDAPSGTATRTCDLIAEARSNVPAEPENVEENVSGARGGIHKGVRVHSVRMPGFVASQEVIFGAPGERLSLRHDSIDRKCFMSGVLLAIRKIKSQKGFIVGLDQLMF